MKAEATKRKAFKRYLIDYFHIAIAELRTQEGTLNFFVAIDRTSKLVYAELRESQWRAIVVGFLVRLIKKVPCQIHTVLTDNGLQSATRVTDHYAFMYLFDRVCKMNGVEHPRTKLNHR